MRKERAGMEQAASAGLVKNTVQGSANEVLDPQVRVGSEVAGVVGHKGDVKRQGMGQQSVCRVHRGGAHG